MLYTLFKRIYRKRIEKDLRDILGYYDFIQSYDTYNEEDDLAYGQSMSWETFMKQLFD